MQTSNYSSYLPWIDGSVCYCCWLINNIMLFFLVTNKCWPNVVEKKSVDALWYVNKSERLIGGDKKGKVNARNVDYKRKRSLTWIKLPFRLSKQAITNIIEIQCQVQTYEQFHLAHTHTENKQTKSYSLKVRNKRYAACMDWKKGKEWIQPHLFA